jgi:glutamyl/glutaminyl-tRNA synthetase
VDPDGLILHGPGYKSRVTEEELERLRSQAREDRRLIRRAEQALAEIDRGPGLSNEQADVLAALRIRLEGKPRKSLDDLLTAAGDISGKKKSLEDVVGGGEEKPAGDWPVVEEKKRDWPGA